MTLIANPISHYVIIIRVLMYAKNASAKVQVQYGNAKYF